MKTLKDFKISEKLQQEINAIGLGNVTYYRDLENFLVCKLGTICEIKIENKAMYMNFINFYAQKCLEANESNDYYLFFNFFLHLNVKNDHSNHFYYHEIAEDILNRIAELGFANLDPDQISSQYSYLKNIFIFDKTTNETISLLHLASIFGSALCVSFLIRASGIEVNIVNSNGKTSLCYAILNAKIDVARILIQHNADLNIQDTNGLTMLHHAVKNKSVLIQFLLDNNVDMMKQDQFGCTAMYYAVQNLDILDIKTIKLFVKKQSSILESCFYKDKTILGYAIKNQSIELVKNLISLGANVNTPTNQQHHSPLYIAMKKVIKNAIKLGWLDFEISINNQTNQQNSFYSPIKKETTIDEQYRKSIEIMNFLIQNQANVLIIGPRNYTPLTLAVKLRAKTTLALTIEETNYGLINKSFLQTGSENNDRTSLPIQTNRQVLCEALSICPSASYIPTQIINEFIKQGADVNIECTKLPIEFGTKNYSCTPLIYAVRIKEIEMVKNLIAKNADLNTTDCFNKTALVYAIEENNEAMVSLLIANKANINTFHLNNETPLFFALKKGNIKIINTLIANNATIPATQEMSSITKASKDYAIKTGNIDIIHHFVTDEELSNPECQYGKTSLFHAIEKENLATISYLITKCKVDANTINTNGLTLLMIALHHPEPESIKQIIELLIQQGADINKSGTNGITPLIYAIQQRVFNIETIKFLIAKGANVNIADKDGKISVMHTLEYNTYNTEEIQKLLIEEGANKNKQERQKSCDIQESLCPNPISTNCPDYIKNPKNSFHAQQNRHFDTENHDHNIVKSLNI